MAQNVATCLAVFFAILEVGSCINCYQCTSLNDTGCGEPFTSQTAPVDCSSLDSVTYNKLNLINIFPKETFSSVPGIPTYCYKIALESGTIIRTCLFGNPADLNQLCRLLEMFSSTSGNDRKVKSCVACDKDNCNGSA